MRRKRSIPANRNAARRSGKPSPTTHNTDNRSEPTSDEPGPRRVGDTRTAHAAPESSTPLPNLNTNGPTAPLASAEGLSNHVLVLNKLYMAIRVVNAKRAFTLLARDAAEVIHNDNGNYANYDFPSWLELSELKREFEPEGLDWVRTVRTDIVVPRIIRLLGYDRLPAQRVKLNRRNLFARDRNRCQYCGHFFPTSELSIDHVQPRSQGGPDTWENLVCACIKCNAKKGGRTPQQARMKLVTRPVRPKRSPLISIKLGNEKYASWKAFLDDAYWSVELR